MRPNRYLDSRRGRDMYRMPRRERDYARRLTPQEREPFGPTHSYYYYDRNSIDPDYKRDLEGWIRRLKSRDIFNLPKHEVIEKAKSMGAKFDEYCEEEYYAVYLMLISDYTGVSNDPHAYLVMAKQFLEDDDIAVSPSEKLCIYLYEIVLGEE